MELKHTHSCSSRSVVEAVIAVVQRYLSFAFDSQLSGRFVQGLFHQITFGVRWPGDVHSIGGKTNICDISSTFMSLFVLFLISQMEPPVCHSMYVWCFDYSHLLSM